MIIKTLDRGKDQVINIYDKNGVKLWQIDINETGKNYSMSINTYKNGIFEGAKNFINKII